MKNWNEYQQQALTTAIYPLEREVDYTVLGLCSEVAEIAEWLDPSWSRNVAWGESIKSEIGDCFWYAAAVADALKIPLNDVATTAARYHYQNTLEETYLTLVTDSGYLAGLVKKAIRDDGGHLSQERRAKMVGTLGRICWVLDGMCHRLSTTRYAVMNDNLNKLSDRKQRGVLQGSGDSR